MRLGEDVTAAGAEVRRSLFCAVLAALGLRLIVWVLFRTSWPYLSLTPYIENRALFNKFSELDLMHRSVTFYDESGRVGRLAASCVSAVCAEMVLPDDAANSGWGSCPRFADLGSTASHFQQPFQRRLFREHEFETVHVVELAGFKNSCQDEIFLQ